MARDQRTAAIIARHFTFLEGRGFRTVGGTFDLIGTVMYVTQAVLVTVSWDWRDEIASISVARRRADDPIEEPYWAGVELATILERRDPIHSQWWRLPADAGRSPSQDTIFGRGAELLQGQCDDLLRGENLELLDEIVAVRPSRGVPGLDFPADWPWASSQEGGWFFTESQMPRSVESYVQRSNSDDPVERVVAALKLPVGMRHTDDREEDAAAVSRLRELLDDPDADVRRAAASSLGEIGDSDSLDRILQLLDLEEGNQPSPLAFAATFIAFDLPLDEKRRVLDRLHNFAEKGPTAARQVQELAWRLGEGDPPAG